MPGVPVRVVLLNTLRLTALGWIQARIADACRHRAESVSRNVRGRRQEVADAGEAPRRLRRLRHVRRWVRLVFLMMHVWRWELKAGEMRRMRPSSSEARRCTQRVLPSMHMGRGSNGSSQIGGCPSRLAGRPKRFLGRTGKGLELDLHVGRGGASGGPGVARLCL